MSHEAHKNMRRMRADLPRPGQSKRAAGKPHVRTRVPVRAANRQAKAAQDATARRENHRHGSRTAQANGKSQVKTPAAVGPWLITIQRQPDGKVQWHAYGESGNSLGQQEDLEDMIGAMSELLAWFWGDPKQLTVSVQARPGQMRAGPF